MSTLTDERAAGILERAERAVKHARALRAGMCDDRLGAGSEAAEQRVIAEHTEALRRAPADAARRPPRRSPSPARTSQSARRR